MLRAVLRPQSFALPPAQSFAQLPARPFPLLPLLALFLAWGLALVLTFAPASALAAAPTAPAAPVSKNRPQASPAAPAASAAAAENAPAPRRIWEQNGLAVFVIQDRPGQMDISLFSGPATPQERAAYFSNGKAEAGVNVFLLRAGLKNILVDSGFGGQVPGQSRLLEQLPLFGLEADDVDAVLISHMHLDHIGGLIANGRAVFPNALLLVSAVEYDYWRALADDKTPSANARLAMQVLEAYGERVRTFMSGPLDDALGLSDASLLALPAFGHTPGHSVFSLGVYEPRLLIISDTIHAAALQFALPQECASYDLDRRAAGFVRESILSLAAETSALVAGMHLPFPACGRVIREGKGFRFELMK